LQRSTIYTAFEKKPEVVEPRPHITGNVEIKMEVEALNPLEEALKNINNFLNNAARA